MAAPQPRPLPAEVQAALERGDYMGAVKLVRSATGAGLEEARQVIDRLRAPAKAAAPGRGPVSGRPAPTTTTWPAGALPAPVIEAITAGRQIDAIRLMREQTGLGLKESKQAVDRYARQHREAFGPLSPGEVPRRRLRAWMVVVLLLLLYLGWRLFRAAE